MEDYIEINVAKDGRHFFATAPRSIHTYPEDHYEEVLKTFLEKFPESVGGRVAENIYTDFERGVIQDGN